MHDPDAPPRLRWRIALWGIAGLFFAPVLYIALAGPVHWWQVWHSGDERFVGYYRTLDPLLHSSPSISGWHLVYCQWWAARPPLRSWRRARLLKAVESLKELARKEEMGEFPPEYWKSGPSEPVQWYRERALLRLERAEQELRWFDENF